MKDFEFCCHCGLIEGEACEISIERQILIAEKLNGEAIVIETFLVYGSGMEAVL